MGDPRRIKNKYSTPAHPWEKLRLEAEKPLMREYGLVNKKELWKVNSKLKNFKDNAKKLVASKSEQAVLEKKQMVDRMRSYGLISSDELDEILGLDVQKVLDRRLQTVVFKKGLARTVKQARQMITHRHVEVNGVKVTAPGYLVRLSDQDSVTFMPGSKFDNDAHPERVVPETTVDVKGKVEEVSEAVKKHVKKAPKAKDEPAKQEESKEPVSNNEESSAKDE